MEHRARPRKQTPAGSPAAFIYVRAGGLAGVAWCENVGCTARRIRDRARPFDYLITCIMFCTRDAVELLLYRI